MADERNELLDAAIDQAMTSMAEAFHELWDRPEAEQILTDFLDGALTFHVSRDRLEVLRHVPAGGPS